MNGTERIGWAAIVAVISLFASSAAADRIRLVVAAGSYSYGMYQPYLHQPWGGAGRGSASGYVDVDLTDGVLDVVDSELRMEDLSFDITGWRQAHVQVVGLGGKFGSSGAPVPEVAPGQYDMSLASNFVLNSGVVTWDEQGPPSVFVVHDWGAKPWNLAGILSRPSLLDTNGPLATWQAAWDRQLDQETYFQGWLSLTEVPEVGTLLLVAAGLVALAGTRRKRN